MNKMSFEILDEKKIWELEKDEDLTLIEAPDDFKAHVTEQYNFPVADFGGFLVKTKDGEFIELWGFYGCVPWLHKTAYKIKLPEH